MIFNHFNHNDIYLQSDINILYNQFIDIANLFEKEEKKEKKRSKKIDSFKVGNIL